MTMLIILSLIYKLFVSSFHNLANVYNKSAKWHCGRHTTIKKT